MDTRSTHRGRRSVLTAAAAAGGALATQALFRPSPAVAASVMLGALNTAAAATTIRTTQALNSAKAIVGVVAYTGPGGSTAGVQGQSNATHGNGVFGVALSGSSKGVWGRTSQGIGVYGEAIGTTSANRGVLGSTPSPTGTGVFGLATATSGFPIGVSGQALAPTGLGVVGFASSGSGLSRGVYGQADSPKGTGVYGYAASGTGTSYGVYGEAVSSSGFGVFGQGGNWGVYGDGINYGVLGHGQFGVYGSGNAYGVYGVAQSTGYAGYFAGKTHVGGTFTATTKNFLIDHPQDPANRTLAHACVEAPEMLNVYRGAATLNSRGAATVRLPRYYGALNRESHVQLTPVGAPAPSLHVATRVIANRFSIAGGIAGQEVYWVVTGVRQDAWARRHPLRVERTKRRQDRGRYLNPEAFGEPASAGIHHAPRPDVPRAVQRRQRSRAAA